MINRRGALFAIKVVVFGGVEWFGSKAQAIEEGSGPRTAPENRQVNEDLAHLGQHIYSEEGIPMFLACENLAASPTSRGSSALNEKVATAFHRYAEEYQRMRPEARAADVAKIIELLAGRDFADGGLEKSL